MHGNNIITGSGLIIIGNFPMINYCPGHCQMVDPFISLMVSTSEDEEMTVLHLYWQIQYELCDWNLWIVTANFTLYPNLVPAKVPITKNSDYNVTLDTMCNRKTPQNTISMNISLSILLNDNITEHVPYIMCELSRIGTNDMIHYHGSGKVYLQSYLHHHVMTSSTATSTQEMQSFLTSNSTQSVITMMLSTKHDDITSSANNILLSYQHMHAYSGALICLIITMFLFPS